MEISRRKFLVLAASLPVAAWAAPYGNTARDVEIWREKWRDAKRDRDVPVKFYYPLRGEAPYPVIVFSHGLGGSREGYEYLGRYWAGQGYISMHVQHIGSDESLLINRADVRATLAEAANARNSFQRARDIVFALDQLAAMNEAAASPLRGKLDLARIGMAGHSFGANTTLLSCGMKMAGPRGQSFAAFDRRIKAGLVLSPPAPRMGDYNLIFGAIRLPLLHMTGTRDESPIADVGTTAAMRRLPFDNIRGADSYLLTLQNGDHMVFSGRAAPGRDTRLDARHHELILQSSTAFWDAYLRDDVRGRSWLRGEFAGELGDSGVFEQKSAKAKA